MSTKITTFEKSLDGKVTASVKDITTFDIPTPVKRNSGRIYKSTERDLHTRTLYRLFYENEIKAYYAKPLTKEQLQERLLSLHPRNRTIRNRLRKYQVTMGMWRKQYNEGILYTSQPQIYFLSFEYDKNGYIVIGGRSPYSYRYFMDCYNKCLIHKVADPRFIPYEDIVAIRNKQIQLDPDWLKWIVPDEVTLQRLRTETGVDELYNSVKFPRGFTREETPTNWTPLKE